MTRRKKKILAVRAVIWSLILCIPLLPPGNAQQDKPVLQSPPQDLTLTLTEQSKGSATGLIISGRPVLNCEGEFTCKYCDVTYNKTCPEPDPHNVFDVPLPDGSVYRTCLAQIGAAIKGATRGEDVAPRYKR